MQRNSFIFVQTKANLFISREIYHILTNRVQLPQTIPLILQQVQVIYPTKYFKRWVRRIQETTSLTREDAVILAYGTFSTTSSQTILGVEIIATTDKKLASEIQTQREKLESKLSALIQNLNNPWSQSRLPKIIILKE